MDVSKETDLILDFIDASVFILDKSNNINYANKNAQTLCSKYTIDDTNKTCLIEVTKYPKFFEGLLETKFDSENHCSILELDNGKQLSWTKHYTESTICLVGQDITEQITSREKNLDLEQRLTSIIESIPGNYWWKDLNGVYLGANHNVAHTLGLTRDKLIGKTDFELPWHEQAAVITANDKEVLESGIAQQKEEVVQDKLGKIRTFLVIKVPLKNNKQEIIGTIGCSIDITERKALEDKLTQANQSKSNFLHAIDRIVRVPLTSVLGTAQVLQRSKPRPDQKQLIDTIVHSSQEITPMLDRVQYYIDVENGSLDNIVSCFELKPYMERILDNYSNKAKQKSLTFKRDYNSKLPQWVRGGSFFLSQIMHNLLSNAVRFTDEGSITVTVDIIQKSTNSFECQISVKDTGKGIHPDELASLFNLFDKKPTSDTTQFVEPGLNLSISHKMAERMNGTLSANSELGHNTEFVLCIPLEIAEAPRIDASKSYKDYISPVSNIERKTDRSRQISILIVEDSVIAQNVLKLMLEKLYQCTIDQAYSVAQANKFIKNDYDITFSDIKLPDGTGLEVIRSITKGKPWGIPPVVAVTTHVNESEREAIIEAGAIDIILKPVDIDALALVVDSYVFEKSHLQDDS